MKSDIIKYIDLDRFNVLLEGFNKSTGFVTAILDLEGNVLSQSGWRQICTDFHRTNPETTQRCAISDTVLSSQLANGEKYHFYKCQNGLVDVAVPIIIGGEHIANLFSGQFFFEEPDHEQFREQARRFGFNEDQYLDALAKVPVVSREKVLDIMDFLLNMTSIISETTRHKMEEQELNRILRQSEERFRSVFESANVGKSITLPTGEIEVNEAFCKMLGYTREELRNKKWQDLTPEDEIPAILALSDSMITGEKDSIRFEKRYICKNGSYIWADVSVTIRRNEIGAPLHFITTIIDITKRKWEEESKRITEERFRIAQEMSPDGFTILLPVRNENGDVVDFTWVYENEAIARINGTNPEHVIGKRLLDLFPSHLATDVFEAYLYVAKTSKTRILEEVYAGEILSKPIWLRLVIVSMGEGIAILTNDISERKVAEEKQKWSEEKFNKAFTISPDAITITRASDGLLVDVNESFELISGYSRQEVVGSTSTGLGLWMNNIDRDRYIHILITNGFVKNFETTFQTKSGQIRYADLSGEIFDLDNQKYFLGVIRDITDRKLLEEQLLDTNDRLNIILQTTPGIVCSFRMGQDGAVSFPFGGERLAELFGIPLSWLTEDAYQFINMAHPEDLPDLQQSLIYSAEHLCSWHHTWRVQHPERGEIWVEGHSMPTREPDGSTLWHGVATDISDLKIAELELGKAQSLFVNAFQVSPVGMTITRIADGKFANANDAFCRLMEYTPQEVIGHTSTELSLWTTEERRKIIDAQNRTGGLQDFELRVRTKTGRMIDVLLSSIFIEMKGEQHHLTIMVDITRRKQAEDMLREREYLTTASQRAAHIGTWSWKVGDTNTYWSEETYRIYGLNPDMGPPEFEFFFEIIHPDDRPKVRDWPAKVIAGLHPPPIEFRVLRTDGVYRVIQTDGDVIETIDGVPTIIAGTAYDITERKQAENELLESREKFRLAFDNSPDLIIISRVSDGVIVDVNTGFTKISGYSKEEVIGKSSSEITKWKNPEDRTRFVKKLMTDGEVIDFEAPLLTRTDEIYGLMSTSIIEMNGIPHVMEITRNITERRKAEEEIKMFNEQLEKRVSERTAQLEAANKELEAFSYSVSHDLRAPLRHINGYIELLNARYRDQIPEKGQQFLGTVSDAAKQMGSLIDDLLQFSRTSRQEIKLQRVDMNSLFKESLSTVQYSMKNRDIKWSVQNMPEVMGDFSMLRQVWINLIDNAVKYTRYVNSAEISIQCEEEMERHIFSIRDNGVGFDMKYAHKLFGVFQRLHSQSEFEGTGIGLANVQRIIFKHNGKVWAESKLGEGATFFFSIPK